jgi:hypothetical protein
MVRLSRGENESAVTTVDVELWKFITVLAGGGESSAVQVPAIGGCGVLAAACARVELCFLDGTNDDVSIVRFLLLLRGSEALALGADVDAAYNDPAEDETDNLFLRLDRPLPDAALSMGTGEILSL